MSHVRGKRRHRSHRVSEAVKTFFEQYRHVSLREQLGPEPTRGPVTPTTYTNVSPTAPGQTINYGGPSLGPAQSETEEWTSDDELDETRLSYHGFEYGDPEWEDDVREFGYAGDEPDEDEQESEAVADFGTILKGDTGGEWWMPADSPLQDPKWRNPLDSKVNKVGKRAEESEALTTFREAYSTKPKVKSEWSAIRTFRELC